MAEIINWEEAKEEVKEQRKEQVKEDIKQMAIDKIFDVNYLFASVTLHLSAMYSEGKITKEEFSHELEEWILMRAEQIHRWRTGVVEMDIKLKAVEDAFSNIKDHITWDVPKRDDVVLRVHRDGTVKWEPCGHDAKNPMIMIKRQEI